MYDFLAKQDSFKSVSQVVLAISEHMQNCMYGTGKYGNEIVPLLGCLLLLGSSSGQFIKFQNFPLARPGIRLPLPTGRLLAPTDQDCFILAPPTVLPGNPQTDIMVIMTCLLYFILSVKHLYAFQPNKTCVLFYCFPINKAAITCDVSTNRKVS